MQLSKRSSDFVKLFFFTLFVTTVISWNVKGFFSNASTFPVYFNRILADISIKNNIMETVYHFLHSRKLK